LNIRAFNKVWNAKLDAKRIVEAEAERAVKAKAAEDMSNWTAQRDIRLHTKKVIYNSSFRVLVDIPHI
jgi:predicted XRE-type DNA-binding protein